jgi:hypothetical protein
MCFLAQNKRGGWLSLRWFWTTLEHTNKELDERLTSLLLLARFFSSALMLLCFFVTACSTGLHLPKVPVHSFACIIAPSTRYFRFESLPCSLASHASMIYLQNKALLPPPCLYFACGLIKDVGGASHDASWCMCG